MEADREFVGAVRRQRIAVGRQEHVLAVEPVAVGGDSA